MSIEPQKPLNETIKLKPHAEFEALHAEREAASRQVSRLEYSAFEYLCR